MLLSNRTVGGSHHRLRDATNILEEEEVDSGNLPEWNLELLSRTPMEITLCTLKNI